MCQLQELFLRPHGYHTGSTVRLSYEDKSRRVIINIRRSSCEVISFLSNFNQNRDMLTYYNRNTEYAISRKSVRWTGTWYVRKDGKTDRHERLSLAQAPNNEPFRCADLSSITRKGSCEFLLNAHNTEMEHNPADFCHRVKWEVINSDLCQSYAICNLSTGSKLHKPSTRIT